MRNKKAKALRKAITAHFKDLPEMQYIEKISPKQYVIFKNEKFETVNLDIVTKRLSEDCLKFKYKESKHYYKLFMKYKVNVLTHISIK